MTTMPHAIDEFLVGELGPRESVDEHRREKPFVSHGQSQSSINYNGGPRMMYDGKELLSPKESLSKYAESVLIESKSAMTVNQHGSRERDLACLDKKLAEGVLGKEFDGYDAVAQNLHPEVLREIEDQRSRNYWTRVQSVFESAVGIYKTREAAERFKEWAEKIAGEGSRDAINLATLMKKRADRMIYTEDVINELKDSRQSGLSLIKGYRETVQDLSKQKDDESRRSLVDKSARIYEVINLIEQRRVAIDKKVMASFRELAEYTAEKSNRRSFPERHETYLGNAVKAVSNKVSGLFGLFKRK